MRNEWELCELSIAQMVNQRRASGAEPKTPGWVYDLLRRLARQIPARYPYEVMCLDRFRISDALFRSDYRNALVIDAVWLLQRGWSVEMSLQAWRNFRTAFPVLKFDPIAFKVMHRDDLIEEYGPTFGNIFADLCIDPDSQPVIGALLANCFEQNIQRAYTLAVTSTEVSMEVMENGLDINEVALQIDLKYHDFNGFGLVDAPASVDPLYARRAYNKCTGGTLPDTFSLHPRDIDYAHPEKAPR